MARLNLCNAERWIGEGLPRKGDWFQTYTGKRFYILDPRPEDICIEDIAHSLAGTSRYGGHGVNPSYSVGEHCCLLAWYTKTALGRPKNDVYQALMHDAAEAYTGDIKRPLKESMPAFKEAFDPIERMLANVFQLTWPEPAWLKTLDNRIVVDEKRANMAPVADGTQWSHERDYEPLGVPISILPWNVVEHWFLQLYQETKP